MARVWSAKEIKQCPKCGRYAFVKTSFRKDGDQPVYIGGGCLFCGHRGEWDGRHLSDKGIPEYRDARRWEAKA